MSKHFIFSATLITLVLFAAVAASAQFTISIPNIPKIKKPKTTQTQDSNQNNTNNTSNNTTNNNNSQDSNAKPSGGCDQYSFVIGVFVDDIKKKQAEAAAYTGPQDKIYYVSETQDDYVRMSVETRRISQSANSLGAPKAFHGGISSRSSHISAPAIGEPRRTSSQEKSLSAYQDSILRIDTRCGLFGRKRGSYDQSCNRPHRQAAEDIRARIHAFWAGQRSHPPAGHL